MSTIQARSLAIILGSAICLSLPGCALTELERTVIVRLGEEANNSCEAKSFAAYYLPYAMLAHAAYTNLDGDDFKGSHEIRSVKDTKFDIKQRYIDGPARKAGILGNENQQLTRNRIKYEDWIRGILDKWTFIGGYQVDDNTDMEKVCESRYDRSILGCHALPGIGLQVWANGAARDGSCEVAVAFRGTDDPDDWFTNFRWITRWIPGLYDQYDQTRSAMRHGPPDAWLEWIKGQTGHVCGTKPLTIVAVGHSLGGGLAQQAAYTSKGGVARVFAFDPSPVTGFYSVEDTLRNDSKERLEIHRVYEGGEILSYFRSFLRRFYGATKSSPAIYNAKFNLEGGGVIDNHSIGRMIQHYMDLIDDGSVTAGDRPAAFENLKAGSEAACPGSTPAAAT